MAGALSRGLGRHGHTDALALEVVAIHMQRRVHALIGGEADDRDAVVHRGHADRRDGAGTTKVRLHVALAYAAEFSTFTAHSVVLELALPRLALNNQKECTASITALDGRERDGVVRERHVALEDDGVLHLKRVILLVGLKTIRGEGEKAQRRRPFDGGSCGYESVAALYSQPTAANSQRSITASHALRSLGPAAHRHAQVYASHWRCTCAAGRPPPTAASVSERGGGVAMPRLAQPVLAARLVRAQSPGRARVQLPVGLRRQRLLQEPRPMANQLRFAACVFVATEMCPHGFDPEETGKREKQLSLMISASNGAAMQGKFVLTFHSHSVELEAPLEDITSDACTQIFRRFQNFGDVSCTRVEFVEPSKAIFDITLHSFPSYPVMNNLYSHNGNPLSSDFYCDSSNVKLSRPNGEISCVFQSKTDTNVKEYAPCSNRGLCNDRIGVCTCQDGYYGENCGNNKDEEDILIAPSTGPFFKGNVLRVSAKRSKSAEFNLIKADVEGRTMFNMNGDGDASLHVGSLFLKEGDLVVQSGQVQIQNGASLAVDRADIRVKNGQIRMQQTSVTKFDAMLLLDMAGFYGDTSVDFMRLTGESGPVFRVSSAGTTVIDHGGLDVLRGGVRVQRGGVHVLSDGVSIINGALNIQNGAVNLHSGSLHVNDGDATFATSSNTKPALSVARLAKVSKTGAKSDGYRSLSGVFELHSEQAEDTLILAKGKHDVEVFELKASGQAIVHSGGLQVDAGGVHIKSGGQTITSGGLVIESGGAYIDGELTTKGGLKIENGGFSVQNNAANDASLRVLSTNPSFGGALLAFDLSNQLNNLHPFRLFEALNADKERIVSVDNRGNVVTQGDITTTNSGKIVASGPLVSEAQVVLSHVKIAAANEIHIPSSHSYVKITDDGETTKNLVKLDVDAAYAGQLLVIQNEDEQALDGDISAKPGSVAIFMFDGSQWCPLTAASFDTPALTGITSFEAANDLNFGEVKLTVQNLQVASQKAGLVAVYGKGGELSQDETLSFDPATHTFSALRLRAEVIQGSIDMSESELRHVEIVGGHISNVNMTSIERMEVDGELFVELDAFFGSGITVDGQVMGSGAYVDASDSRFKKDIEPIRNALDLVEALEGVEYSYRTDEFPERNFGTERELGFVAQQVEMVLPQVVTTDETSGFKYVAYARVVPVVVEALKGLHGKTQDTEAQVAELREQVHELREMVAAQQKMLEAFLGQAQM